jgi:hypothetical protein
MAKCRRHLRTTLARVAAAFEANPKASLCFGHCRIINEDDLEIRQAITKFKRLFYPLSSRFTIQCINYVSQPAMFFRRSAFSAAGPIREDLKAAWDYDLILRLWRQGDAIVIDDPPLANFRWHAQSISGQHFERQFAEELQAAQLDAGVLSLQSLLHWGVKWGIISIYKTMSWNAQRSKRTV